MMEANGDTRGRFWMIKVELQRYREMNDLFAKFWETEMKVRVQGQQSQAQNKYGIPNPPALFLLYIPGGRSTLDVAVAFPATTHGSFFVSLYGFLEQTLKGLCDGVFKRDGDPFIDNRGGVVSCACKYIEKTRRRQVPGILGCKDQRELLRLFRNELAHSGQGIIGDMPDEKLCQLTKHGWNNRLGVTATRTEIKITKEFIAWFVDELDKVFAELATAAGVDDYDKMYIPE